MVIGTCSYCVEVLGPNSQERPSRVHSSTSRSPFSKPWSRAKSQERHRGNPPEEAHWHHVRRLGALYMWHELTASSELTVDAKAGASYRRTGCADFA